MYVSQELALYKEFSIKETMTYYGRLFGMSGDQIETRTYELLKFLELPNEKNIVSRLRYLRDFFARIPTIVLL